MSRILVMFGTTDGQTAKVAEALGTRLRLDRREVDVVNAASAQPDPGDTDTSRDYEYTDWADLQAFAGRFSARLTVAPAAMSA